MGFPFPGNRRQVEGVECATGALSLIKLRFKIVRLSENCQNYKVAVIDYIKTTFLLCQIWLKIQDLDV